MARRRRRTVKSRRPRRSTRAGGRRVTARRAYRGLPRRRRSNPKGIFQTPAARYALWAGGGAAAGIVLEQTPLLKKQVPNPIARAAIFAAITIFVGRTMKGRVKENAVAMGIGMVIPSFGAYVAAQDLGSALKFGNGNGNGNGTEEIIVVEKKMISSNPGHAYSAANAQIKRVSNGGLRAL